MEFDSTIPIYLQVMNQIKKDLIQGNLVLGEKMPSTRDLALEYKINPNTASRIYKDLESEGICYTKRGIGTFVTENAEILKQIKNEIAEAAIDNFITSMRALGLTKEETIQLIESHYDRQ